jgi:hypothetical protein
VHAVVGEHGTEGEAQPEPADQHPQRVVGREREGVVGHRALRGVLEGVHHEHPVGAELEVAVVAPPQHQLAASRRGTRDGLHGERGQSKISLSQLSFLRFL